MGAGLYLANTYKCLKGSAVTTRGTPLNIQVDIRFASIIEWKLAAFENTLFALLPIKRIVPTTNTKITASITAYSAMSWPSSCRQSLRRR
jgi:hypothetical protein